MFLATSKFIFKATNFYSAYRVYSRCFSLHKLNSDYKTLQYVAKQFSKTKLKPIAAELDKKHTFPAKQIKELGDLGLLSVLVHERWGGSGHNILGLSVIVEELSQGCASTGAIVSIHNCLYANLVNNYGTLAQKETFLRPCTKGDVGCFALSEPDAGSDVSSLSTTAILDGDSYILNGTKSWVTSGPVGKAAVIFATVDKALKHKGITAFLLPLPTQGLSLGKEDDKLGIRAAPSCNFYLDNVRVPKDNVIGEVGAGFKLAMKQLDVARVGIASQAIGIGQAALDLALEYSSQRKAFGQPINQLQAVKIRIANMSLRLESARLLVRRAAAVCDEEERSTKECSMAKLAASEAATYVTHNCIQILGGMGYVTDMPAERHYRDARITEIYGGISDIQRLVIGDLIIRGNK